jgi:hypothetical protein
MSTERLNDEAALHRDALINSRLTAKGAPEWRYRTLGPHIGRTG